MRSYNSILGASIARTGRASPSYAISFMWERYGPFPQLVRLVFLLTNSHCVDHQENEPMNTERLIRSKETAKLFTLGPPFASFFNQYYQLAVFIKPSTVSVIVRPCRLLYCVATSNPGLQNEAFIDQQGLFFSFLHLKKELPGKTSFFLKPRNYFKINFSFKFHVVKKFLHIILMIISTILWSIFSSSK